MLILGPLLGIVTTGIIGRAAWTLLARDSQSKFFLREQICYAWLLGLVINGFFFLILGLIGV